MARKIKDSGLFEARWLAVSKKGIRFPASGVLGGTKRYAFWQIDAVLLQDRQVLSVQMGDRTYSVRVKPKHQEIVDRLVAGCRASLGA